MTKPLKLMREQLAIYLVGELGNLLWQPACFSFQKGRGVTICREYRTFPLRENPLGFPWLQEMCPPRISLKTMSFFPEKTLMLYIFVIYRKKHFVSRLKSVIKKLDLFRAGHAEFLMGSN